ncbi:hypothetical protein DTL42_19480 [Bremerella cremea]|uniref:Uncharacterized protein n=1 Tax=Bremerella cremea TaxID=1031537 RepID=A0A368KMC2_9BACT|nr:hypothetical protein [Bremerella cremea]RCS42322.1 hypothetical protein DTL42_19480 [Bremerella cremea]
MFSLTQNGASQPSKRTVTQSPVFGLTLSSDPVEASLEFSGDIWRRAKRLTGSEESAQELIADTLLALYDSLDSEYKDEVLTGIAACDAIDLREGTK